jgi:hypothetical protein
VSRKRKNRIPGGFVIVPYVMMDTEAWKNLSGNAIKIYLEIHKRNWEGIKYGEEFIMPYGYYRDKTGISKPAFYKILKSLTEQGFLEKTEHGGLFGKASKYKSVEGWKTNNKGLQKKNQEITQPWSGVGAAIN